ncbi:hypothetical protein A11A3_16135 [Alcanivorax hongdengensis A-11-3]|uniref:Protein CbrA n=1 Tax=Alcanivorax hongdengensis A-11-3 TaxID=1177179 RepID=L0W7Q2_9GAMM|nr:geranylgeranyl reductase family protein [Alcanivorax hongdengensis]EKF72969.1 hypothetical protein A11A3_16135 [Alcanivorax hongdengensis A-11-3]
MTTWDVIIVGAGQAGSAAAWDLARSGLQVLVLHRPGRRAKPCAGGLTMKTLQRYRFDIGPVIRERIDTLHVGGSRPGRVALSAPSLFCVMTERGELDAYCLEQAREQGAQVAAVTGLKAVTQNHHGVTVTDSQGRRYAGRYLLAADGANSSVARLLGLPRHAGAMAIEGLVPRQALSDWPGMTLDFDALPGGYGWLFPKGDHVNVGLYIWQHRLGGADRPALDAYCRRTLGCTPDQVAGYPLGTWLPQGRLSQGRILFVGDAAGCTESLLGEGIYGAVLSGQWAAQALLGPAPAQHYQRAMQPWREELRQVNQLSRLFYPLRPVSTRILQGRLGSTLVEGFARGLTLGQCKRRWRGAGFSGWQDPVVPDSAVG